MVSPHHLFAALAFFAVTAAAASNCNPIGCGGTSLPVPYPFGFSDGCPIRLNCSAGKIQLGGYAVRNFSNGSAWLDVPPDCSRPIRNLTEFFGGNYALTATNALFLRHCSNLNYLNSCIIPTDTILQPMKQASCDIKNDTGTDRITCYSTGMTEGFISKEYLMRNTTDCGSLFASAKFADTDDNKSTIEIGTAEIGSWLDGECRCAANASCNRVNLPPDYGMNKTGFQCSCNPGFVGDGFADGDGCMRDDIKKHDVQVGVIAAGVACGASLALGAVLLFYCLCCRSSSTTEESTQRLISETSCTVAVFSHKDVLRATANFSDSHKLGSGAYATVYMGRFSNSAGLVAIKKLKHPDTDNVEHVINEIKLVSSVSHPNLVQLLGCCIGGGHHILVYEFMPNGTLSQHLHRERGDGLTWPARVGIATGTARAVAYLHTALDPPVYHRDIKSSNILLDHDLRPKVADFGLSRAVMLELSHISTAPQGTPGYVDPQYHQNFHLSDKSDVYSFGVVLVEMITAMKVVDFSRPATEVNLATLAADRIGKGLVEEIVDPVIKWNWDGRTRASVQKVAELAFRCLAFHREARPAMAEVAEELDRISMEIRCSSACQREDDEAERILLAEKVNEVVSPVSVQEHWASEHSCSSSSSLANGSFHNLNR